MKDDVQQKLCDAKFPGRSVYDLDEARVLCLHDWVVPAAEELLELLLCLSLPGREREARSLEATAEGVARGTIRAGA